MHTITFKSLEFNCSFGYKIKQLIYEALSHLKQSTTHDVYIDTAFYTVNSNPPMNINKDIAIWQSPVFTALL